MKISVGEKRGGSGKPVRIVRRKPVKLSVITTPIPNMLSDIDTKERIVVFSTDPWLDRLHGLSVLSIFKSLADLGYEILVLVPCSKSKVIVERSILIKCINVRRYIPLFSLISLYKHYLKFYLKFLPLKGDSIIIFDYPMFLLFLFIKFLWRTKGIMLILSRPIASGGLHGHLMYLHYKISLLLGRSLVDLFTQITPYEAAEAHRIAGIPLRKLLVVPSPLGNAFLNYRLFADKKTLRQKLGLNALIDKKIILYHGVLDERRGILRLLKLFTEAFTREESIALLIVGDGPDRGLVERFIRENNADKIFYYGKVPYSKMPEIISSVDAGLVVFPDIPLWRYQCPTKLIELIAMGKPVVASDLPGIKWVAGNSSLVVYVNPLDKLTHGEFKKGVERALELADEVNISPERYRPEVLKVIERFSCTNIASRLDNAIRKYFGDHSENECY